MASTKERYLGPKASIKDGKRQCRETEREYQGSYDQQQRLTEKLKSQLPSTASHRLANTHLFGASLRLGRHQIDVIYGRD